MILVSEVNGWESVTLTNGLIEVTVLPAKGGDIYALVDKESGLDVLMKSPRGLSKPPTTTGSGNPEEPIEFLRNYEGGWQTLFPNIGDECVYRGQRIPFHGEAALRPWHWERIAGRSAIRMHIRCQTVPLELTRILSVADKSAQIRIEDVVSTYGDTASHFVLGHHLVLGAPFLQEGNVLDLDAETVVSADEYWEDTARIEARQTSNWPFVRGRCGETIDLRRVEGPSARSHDDVCVTGLRHGTARVLNPDLGLAVRLDWDADVFRWIALWQVFGGAEAGSLAGTYALGLEPWTSRVGLANAVTEGSALSVDVGESFQTAVTVSLSQMGRSLTPAE